MQSSPRRPAQSARRFSLLRCELVHVPGFAVVVTLSPAWRANGRSSTPPAAPVTAPCAFDISTLPCGPDTSTEKVATSWIPGPLPRSALDRHTREQVRGDHLSERGEDREQRDVVEQGVGVWQKLFEKVRFVANVVPDGIADRPLAVVAIVRLSVLSVLD
jgi:hypothetical protein